MKTASLKRVHISLSKVSHDHAKQKQTLTGRSISEQVRRAFERECVLDSLADDAGCVRVKDPQTGEMVVLFL